jgi:hypothetical protein
MATRGVSRTKWLASAVAAVLISGCLSASVASPTASPLPTQTLAPTAGPTASPVPTLGPTATASPTLTPTSPATPSPSPSTPTGGEELDQAEIDRHLDALAGIAVDQSGRRAAGTDGYDASADYVAGQLADMGYQVSRQPFSFTYFDEQAPVSLVIGEQSWSGAEWLHAMLYSAEGNVSGELQFVGIVMELLGTAGCEADDWNDFAAGRIAVLASGPCPRRSQVINAQDAGAIALIGLYPTWGPNEIRRPTLFESAGIDIPVIVAGEESAAALLAAAATNATAEITVDVEMAPASDDNVFAELPGTSTQVVMLGGHLDSSLDGPGINDNGSGVATLLAMAAAFAERPAPEHTIRFAFWGAEEFGTHGSRYYVDNLPPIERDRIEAYINLDMVGSPDAARFVYDDEFGQSGSSAITVLLLDTMAENGTPGLPISSGGSDHSAFLNAGIATGGVFSGIAPLTPEEAQLFSGQVGVQADPCYHLACDDRSNVDTQAAFNLGSAVAAVVWSLANPDR